MTYENLLVEKKDGIGFVTVNRPHVLNALNDETMDEIRRAFLDFQQDEEVLAVILTGTGEKAFIAGADINELAVQTPIEGKERSLRGQKILALIEHLGKPVIAAINGFALGGGCELALACTVRVASTTARLGQPEVKLGLIPGYGGSQRLPRLVGKGRALELLLTGEMISAEEAYRIGLVNKVTSPQELIPVATDLARKMTANAPPALRHCLEAVHSGMEMPLDQGLFLEASLFGLCSATEDMKEGTRAFLEKRKAVFKGK